MSLAAHRRTATRTIVLDRSLEALPLFRLSDSADDSAVTYTPESGGRWRVLPTPGDRVPGTFDQDVYVELLRRYHEASCPEDGGLTFTLHAFEFHLQVHCSDILRRLHNGTRHQNATH